MALSAGEKLFLSEEHKDIVFLVGRDERHYARFPAHKVILASFSDVFAAMLSDKYKEGGTGQVIITDVTPAAFRYVLQFAYTGKFRSPTIATCEEILYIADKYLLLDLTKFCFAYLEKLQVNISNIWNFLNIIFTFYSESMSSKIVTATLHYLDENAEVILDSDEFGNLSSDAVSKIIKRSSLKVATELKILVSVFHWAKAECCRQGLDITEENKRKVLKNIKFDIRYLLIPRNVLLSDAMIQVFLTKNERTIMLDDSLQVNRGLPLPWNNNLLMTPRGINHTMSFDMESNFLGDPQNVFSTKLLLVVPNDCILQNLEITYNRVDANGTKVTTDITDLDGNIYGTWTSSRTAGYDNVLIVSNPICLQKFKAYKLNVACLRGHIVSLYDSLGFCDDLAGRAYFFVGDFPTDAATLSNLRSSNFWEKVMTHDSSVAYFYESNRNRYVSLVSITM